MKVAPQPDTRRAWYIHTEDALDKFATQWLPQIDGATVALDIEEERGYHYHPRVALIQLSVHDQDVILDPIELTPPVLAPVLEHILLTAAPTIVHGGRNDIAGLQRDFGVVPNALRDTQIAARFLGAHKFGLSALLKTHFGIVLDKEQRRSDWGKRPLSEEQLLYAQHDTTYLEALWDTLASACERAGWTDAVIEECEVLRHTEAETLDFDPQGWRRIKSLRKQSQKVRARAATLWAWRDATGQKANIHPSHVLPKWAFEQTALRGVEWMVGHKKLTHRLQKIHPDILTDLQDALSKPTDVYLGPIKTPHAPSPAQDPEILRARYHALKAWRAKESKKTQLDAGWLAPRSVLETVARHEVDELDHLADHTDVRQWRLDRYHDAWSAILAAHRSP